MKWGALFPGQGSQHTGMAKFLFDNFSSSRELFELASDTLSLNFKKLCFDGPEDQLNLTENTQPALLLASVASFRALHETSGFRPELAAGHSAGEYAALTTADALTFVEALKAVRRRGQAMQSAVPFGKGGMLAVLGLDEKQILELCKQGEKIGVVEAANFNAPGQIVISGESHALKWVQENVKPEDFHPPAKRLRFIPLKVSAPFHSRLMKPAEEVMAQTLNEIKFNKSKWSIVQNFTAQPHSDPEELRTNLIKQISGPVRWTECMKQAKLIGVTQFIEFSPGKVLAGLLKKIDSDSFQVFSMTSLDEFRDIEQCLTKGNP